MPVSKYSQQRKAATTTPSGKLKKPDTYVCTRCGNVFNKKDHLKNFSTVKSPLWESNDYKLPICNDCLKFYYNFYFTNLGDAHSAYRRICMKFDMYYSDDIVNSIMKNEQSSDRIGLYISQLNYARYAGKTYDNTIEEEGQKILYGDCVFAVEDENGEKINIKLEYEKLKEQLSEQSNKSLDKDNQQQSNPELEDLFGFGFTPKEQDMMYKLYTTQQQEIPPKCLAVLDESLKDLCKFKALQGRAIEANDLSEISKYSDLYQKTRKYIDGVVNKQLQTAANDEENISIGSLIKEVEQFCPAEIYKKKSIFEDIDGIGEYIERFMYRPLRNFLTGSREQDKEFSVGDGE